MCTKFAIPCLVRRCQQKATVSSWVRRKNCLSGAMRCMDATENRRDITAAATFQVSAKGSAALVDRYKREIFGPGVVCGRANQLVVDPLFDDMGTPARGACDHEQGREHCRGNAQHVVGDGTEPIEVGEHAFGIS